MLKLKPANSKWWNKPLALDKGRNIPAELIILRTSLKLGEEGVWLNSRGIKTGVIDLKETAAGKYETVRHDLPDYVQKCLKNYYEQPNIAKGVYDLVIWHNETKKIRFIEVKCPHWDRLTIEQEVFAEDAKRKGIAVEVKEWEFDK